MTRLIDADALKQKISKSTSGVSLGITVREYITNLLDSMPTALSITPSIPAPIPLAPAYRANKGIAFDAPYDDTMNWVSGRTSAYPGYGVGNTQTNPNDSKLDVISASFSRPSNIGTFAAELKPTSANWATQLVTTEGSIGGFKVKTGDVVACDFTPNAQLGVWPALWTWNGPSNEVDIFEFHGDNPTTIEFTNHVRPSAPDYPKILTPGTPAHIETVLGSTSVDWYVDGKKIFSDGKGVGDTFSAYLIANLSVQAANQYHPGPNAGVTILSARIANVTVFR